MGQNWANVKAKLWKYGYRKDDEDDETDTDDDDLPPAIVMRKEWGAAPPLEAVPMTGPVSDVINTDTGTRECTSHEDCAQLVKEIQEYQMKTMQLPDIAYHFLVGGNGFIYEGRGWRTKGGPYGNGTDIPPSLEGRSIEIAFIGKYQDKEPRPRMMKAASKLVKYGYGKGYVISAPEKEKEFVREVHSDAEEKQEQPEQVFEIIE